MASLRPLGAQLVGRTGRGVATASTLSRRAQRNLQPLSSYFPQFEQAMQRPWTPSDPDGCIVMVVAENRLASDMFLERLHRCQPADKGDLYYSNFRGTPRFRESIAHFMSRCVVSKANPIAADNLAVGNGCGTVLDNLFYSLCDAGDSVLIPAPLYPTFTNDLEAKCELKPVIVRTKAERGYFPTPAELDEAAASAPSAPRALLLTNPTNPLGTVFAPGAYAEAIRWAVKRGMHAVSDEIYACSIFGDSMPEFVSGWDVAAELNTDAERELVHVVYGLAKDFGVSGLRVGMLASRNQTLLKMHSNVGYFSMIPNPIQAACAEILSDDAWVDSFLNFNRAELRRSYDVLTAALDGQGVTYMPGGASMFLWLDLREALSAAPTWEEERALFHRMHGHGILLTPGRDCFAEEPGFFRACWAASSPEAHATAAERIASVVRG